MEYNEQREENFDGIDDILKKTKRLLLKHNALVSLSGDLSVTQYKAYNVLLFAAKKVLSNINDSQNVFSLKISTLCEFAGIELNDNYSYVKKALEDVSRVKIETDVLKRTRDDAIEWGFMYLLASANIKRGTINYSFPGEILDALKQPKFYAQIDLDQIKLLEGKASFVLYENLVSYKNMYGMTLKTSELRKLLSMEKKYEKTADFKRKIIEPAIAEINKKTDLQVTVEYIIIERRLEAVKFVVENIDNVVSMRRKNEKLFSIRTLFDNYKINYKEKDSEQFLGYEIDNIKKGLDQLKHKKGVRNDIAYLHKAVQSYEAQGFFSVDELEDLREREKEEVMNRQKEILELLDIKPGDLFKKL